MVVVAACCCSLSTIDKPDRIQSIMIGSYTFQSVAICITIYNLSSHQQRLALTTLAALGFGIVAITAYIHHRILVSRYQKTDQEAKESRALVSSLFPKGFRERLMQERVTKTHEKAMKKWNKLQSDFESVCIVCDTLYRALT